MGGGGMIDYYSLLKKYIAYIAIAKAWTISSQLTCATCRM